MADVINVDWLNENAYRNYPLVDGASRIAASGGALPQGLLVDLSMPVPLGSLDPSRAFIRKVYGFAAGVVITIGDISDPGADLATATVFTADHTFGRSYPLSGLPGTVLEGAVGRVTIGLPDSVAQCSMGLFDFSATPEATRLVVSCIRPLLAGISGIVIRDSAGISSSVLGGTVTFQAGPNISLSYDPGTGVLVVSSSVTVTPNTIAAAGCGCDETLEGPPNEGIKTINGIPPDGNGNFIIEGRKTTVVQPLAAGSGISIHDDSAEPCCECDQLAELTSGLSSVDASRAQLLTVAEQLQARITNLTTVIINAGLNPPAVPPTEATPDCWWWLPVGAGGYGGVLVPCV